MINDLDETLRTLLIRKAGLDPAEVDISFDIPTRDWSTPVTRPTVNLYLYDLRENRELRETYWDQEPDNGGRVRLKPRPVRMDLSYMVTCWTSATEDQHRLLWRVLETLFQNSPLPEDVLQGSLRNQIHPIRTQVAQAGGVLANVSDFWGALENQMRPSISLVVTLELDLAQIRIEPLTFARVARIGQSAVDRLSDGREVPARRLEPGWEALPVQLSGVVKDKAGEPLPGAAVRIIGTQADGRPLQIGATTLTDEAGRYTFAAVPAGEYTLVVEVPGQSPQQRPLKVMAGAPGEALPEFVHEVEVPMTLARK
jgi:hypothetical protein